LKLFTEQDVFEFLSKNSIELKATQGKICLPILNRLCKKMTIGIKFPNIKTIDGLIVDGHHRYLASILLGYKNLGSDIWQKPSVTDIISWESISYTNEEWDTEAKILMLNEFDAKFNNISIDKLG
jgi:hypothetical protein